MQLVRPGPEHLTSYVAALEHGWSADNERGIEAAHEELSRIQADAAAFLASMEDREAKGPPVTLPDGSAVQRPRASGAGSGTASSAGAAGCGGSQVSAPPPHCLGHIGYAVCRGSSASGMQSQRYASCFRKPRRRPSVVEITTDPDNIASQRVIEANGGVFVSTSSNRRSSATSLACAFASCSHNGV